MLTKKEITNPAEEIKTRYIRVKNNLEFCKYVAKVAAQNATQSIVDQYAESLKTPQAMYNFVRQHSRYVKDPITMDTIKHPSMILSRIRAGREEVSLDCDCATCLLAALLLNRGFSVRLCSAHIVKPNEARADYKKINHIFLQFKQGDRWLSLEPSSKTPLPIGQQAPNVLPLFYIYITVGGGKINDEI